MEAYHFTYTVQTFTIYYSSGKGKSETVLHQAIGLFLSFVSENRLQKSVRSFVLLVSDEKFTDNIEGAEKLDGFSNFWSSVFQTIDPAELLIIAPAEALGVLTSCHVYAQDRWSFDSYFQYLRLQQSMIEKFHTFQTSESPTTNNAVKLVLDDTLKVDVEAEAVFNSPENLLRRPLNNVSRATQLHEPQSSSFGGESLLQETPRAESSALFDIRPWSSLLLNEGSFVKAYSMYEFWLKQPPSILPELLGADEESTHRPYISPTIREFSYIGMFPMASHFNSLTQNLPRIVRLYVQLVPRPLEILEDPERMEEVDSEDLWMERNSCYAVLMRELFNSPPLHNYRYLEVFESGDAADADAWQMAVDYVKRAGQGWKVVAEGILVRDPKDLGPEPEESDDEEGSSLSIY